MRVNTKFFLALAVIIAFTATGFAQSGLNYSHLGETEVTVPFGELYVYEGILTNTGDSEDIIVVSLRHDDVPENWHTSMCINSTCYPPFLREINDTLAVSAFDTIYVDFYPATEGDGSLYLHFQSTNDPAIMDSVFLSLHARGEAVGDQTPATVNGFEILSVYPNPFNSATRVQFTLPSAGNVELAVFSMDGRLISEMAPREVVAGTHSLLVQATPDMSSGVYLIRMQSSFGNAFTRAFFIK